MSLTLTMWPASDEHIRLEHETIRDAQERAYMNGRAANGIVPSQSARAQCPRDIAQYSMMHQQIHPGDQVHPIQFVPKYKGSDSMGYFNSSEAQESISTFASQPHSIRMNTARLLRLRDDRVEDRLGLTPEFARQQQIDGSISVSAAQLERDDKAYSPFAVFDACRLPTQVNGTYRPPETDDKGGVHTFYTGGRTYETTDEQGGLALDISHASKLSPKSRKRAAEEQPRKSKKKDTKWLITLEELKDYKKEYGNTIVPRGYSQNPRLASWVAEQRKQFKLLHDKKQSSITQERIDLLNELDFAWNAQEAAWSRHVSDLRSFQAETGHCHVPLNHHKYPRLGLWVKEQRRHHTLMTQGKPSHMTAERCVELNSLGFCYDTHESTWMERWRELAEYREQHGSCVVPSNYHNTKLSTWVHHQRRQFKRLRTGQSCHITDGRIRLLNQLGFIWNPRQCLSDADDDSSSDEEGDELTYLSDNEDEETSSSNKKPTQKKRARRS